MNAKELTIRVVSSEEAEAWLTLRSFAQQQIRPTNMDEQVLLFLSSPSEIAHNRFIAWLDDTPIACWIVRQLDYVVDLCDLFILPDYVLEYGPQIIRHIISLARSRGKLLTVEHYPPAYRVLFSAEGFQERKRMRMWRSLDGYQIQLVRLPEGIQLRPPRMGDEATIAHMIFEHYQGTPDAPIVTSSPTQAAAMGRAIFGEQYAPFDLECSFIAEDAQKNPVGHIFLGNESTEEEAKLVWILDLLVYRHQRGKGLGRGLLVYALNAARTRGYATIGLTVTCDNQQAVHLYRSLGFHERGDALYEAILYL